MTHYSTMAYRNVSALSLRLVCIALALASWITSVPRGYASGTVTNCTESDLRIALLGGGTALLACDSTITLASPIVVAKQTVLDGTGHNPSVSGPGASGTGTVFIVQPGASLTLRNLTVTNGRLVGPNGTNGAAGQPARGAAIYCDHGIVTLDGCTVSGHSVAGGAGSTGFDAVGNGGNGGDATGAAIFNFGGQLVVTNTTFSGNSATGGAGGSGIASSTRGAGGRGGNGGMGSGAAIYNTANGLASVFSSLFSSNSVTGSAAGIGGPGSGLLGFPGGTGTAGSAFGAAICNESGTVTIVDSTFVANAGVGAPGSPGAAAGGNIVGANGSTGGSAQGGGVFNGSGTLSLTNCTFAENSLDGGAGGPGGAGGTFGFGSEGGPGGDGGAALGAGICVSPQGITLIVNCTFSDNGVTGGAGGVGGAGGGLGGQGPVGTVGTAVGGAVFNQGGNVQLKNSILAYSLSGGNVSGIISDDGFNLSSDATPKLNAQGSRNNIDPLLGSFTPAGGLVPTLTLLSNSPAINAITAPQGNGGPAFDQRNALRVAPYDIGAFEFGGTVGIPSLTAQILAKQIILSWAVSGSFALETATTLSTNSLWLNVGAQPSTMGSLQTVTVPTTNQASFYRLIAP
jgi:hypothetical protein